METLSSSVESKSKENMENTKNMLEKESSEDKMREIELGSGDADDKIDANPGLEYNDDKDAKDEDDNESVTEYGISFCCFPVSELFFKRKMIKNE